MAQLAWLIGHWALVTSEVHDLPRLSPRPDDCRQRRVRAQRGALRPEAAVRLGTPMLVMYSVNPSITNEALNRLFSESWDGFQPGDFEAVLSRSLAFVCAFYERRLVGYVNVAWDGGIHAFLLDTTVHPSVRRQGIGTELVRRAVDATRQRRNRLAARRLRAAPERILRTLRLPPHRRRRHAPAGMSRCKFFGRLPCCTLSTCSYYRLDYPACSRHALRSSASRAGFKPAANSLTSTTPFHASVSRAVSTAVRNVSPAATARSTLTAKMFS